MSDKRKALEIFDRCAISVFHGLETDTQKEHYDIRVLMSGKEYREFRAALTTPEDKA